LAIFARTLDGGLKKQPGQRGDRLRHLMCGGTAEAPVLDLERSG
jgi:uncharacterized protein YceH (UPF0502 family)